MTVKRCSELMVSGAILAAGVALPHGARAQEVPAPSAAPGAAQVAADADATSGDIVVTAQKRSENLQRVPLSVLVLDGARLKERNLTSLSDIQSITPGVSIRSFYTNVSGSINIRGVGTQALTVPTVEQTVSVVADGVSIGTFSGALFNFNDLERVEVLRGPQGNLFGKGASNGIINIVSAAPTDTLTGSFGASYGTLNEVKLRGTLSGPLSDTLSLRLSGYRTTRDGLGKTILPSGDAIGVDNVDEWGVRGQIQFKPSADLKIRLIGDYSNSDTRCCVAFQTVADVPADAGTAAFLGLPVGYPLPMRGAELPQSSRTGYGEEAADVYERINGYGLTGLIDYNVGDYTVSSVTGWRRTILHGNGPGDFTPYAIFLQNQNDFKFTQFSQEVRVTSPADQLVAFTAGLFYFHSTLDYEQTLRLGAAPPVYNLHAFSTIKDDNYAAFGQATVNVSPSFRLIVGGRYTYDEQSLAFRNLLPATLVVPNPRAGFFAAAGIPFFATPFVIPRLFQANDLDSAFSYGRLSYKLGAQYDVAPGINVFATYSRGFKSGGFLTDPTAIVDPANVQIRPETPKGFEIGLRSRLLDRRLTLNLTYFDFRFDGLQTTQYDANLGSFRLANENARTHGVELEASARPTRTTTLTLNGAYTEAKFRGGATDQCYFGQTPAQGCGANGFQDLDGTRLPDAPRWTYTAGVRQEVPVPASNLRGYVDVSYFWRSGANLQPGGGPDTYQPSYDRLDATIGTVIPVARGNLNLRVYARNLTKSDYATARLSVPPSGFWAAQLVSYESGRRVFGVAADFTF